MNETPRQSPDEIERDIRETRAHIDGTLERLERKFSPGELLHEAVEYARRNGSVLAENSAIMAGNVGRTARDNPIPLALLGVGLSWLMMSDRRPADRDSGASDDGSRTHEFGREATERVKDVTDRAMGAASSTGAQVGRAASNVRQSVEETASKVQDDAQHAAARLRSGAADAAAQARERVATVGSGVRDSATHAARSASRFANDHPLATGAMMLAVGATIAALLPRTRRENRWAGAESDRAKRAVAREASEFAEQTVDAARAAASQAKAEAEKQGLTSERAKKEAAAVAEAGSEVAASAARAAEKEFKARQSQESEGADPDSSGSSPAQKEQGQPRSN